MANHLVTNMQPFIIIRPNILLNTQSPSMCGNTLLLEAFQHWSHQGSTRKWLHTLNDDTCTL